MASTPLGLGALQTGINLGAIFESIATGTLITSAAFAPAALSGSAGGSFPDMCDLWLVMGAAMTLGTGAPFIQAALLPSNDGTNYEIAGVSNSQLFPYAGGVTTPLIPSQVYASGNVIRVPGIVFTSAPFAKLIANWQGGATLPASVTAALYPSGYSAG